MSNLFNKEDLNEVARLVSELKAIVGDGIEEYRGILGIDVTYIENFQPRVQVDNELLEDNFKNIKSNDEGRNFVIISGVEFFSIGNDK